MGSNISFMHYLDAPTTTICVQQRWRFYTEACRCIHSPMRRFSLWVSERASRQDLLIGKAKYVLLNIEWYVSIYLKEASRMICFDISNVYFR